MTRQRPPDVRCACGCGAWVVVPKGGHRRRYLNRAHHQAHVASPAMAEFRRRRTAAANAGVRRARTREMNARAAHYATPAEAFTAGCRIGFNRAACWHRRRYARLYAQWEALQAIVDRIALSADRASAERAS